MLYNANPATYYKVTGHRSSGGVDVAATVATKAYLVQYLPKKVDRFASTDVSSIGE